MTNWSHVLLLKIALGGIVITLWDSFCWDSPDLSCFSHLLSVIQASNMLKQSPNIHPVSCILIRPGWLGNSMTPVSKDTGQLLEIGSSVLFLGKDWVDEEGMSWFELCLEIQRFICSSSLACGFMRKYFFRERMNVQLWQTYSFTQRRRRGDLFVLYGFGNIKLWGTLLWTCCVTADFQVHWLNKLRNTI